MTSGVPRIEKAGFTLLESRFSFVFTEPLLLADTENLRATNGAYPLGGRPAVLHFDGLGALDFPLSAALHTICLHVYTSFLALQLYFSFEVSPIAHACQ